jgi:hypothetical protein
MTLKLTAAVRHNFWWLPFAVVFGGFVLALIVTFLTTEAIPSLVSKLLVNHLVASSKIKCLANWVKEQRKTTSDGTLLPVIRTLVAYGPSQAKAARERLKGALAVSRLAPDHPLRTSAAAEAGTEDHEIGDFYDNAGVKLERHRADDLIGTLNLANAIHGQLERARRVIEELPGEGRTGLEKLLTEAERVFGLAEDDVQLAEAENEVRELWRKIHDVITEQDLGEDFARRRVGVQVLAMQELADPALPIPMPGYSTLPPWPAGLPSILGATLATVSMVAVLMVVAVATVASATYIPSSTFGVWTDYLALLVAAFGSSAVAGILSTLLISRVKKA